MRRMSSRNYHEAIRAMKCLNSVGVPNYSEGVFLGVPANYGGVKSSLSRRQNQFTNVELFLFLFLFLCSLSGQVSEILETAGSKACVGVRSFMMVMLLVLCFVFFCCCCLSCRFVVVVVFFFSFLFVSAL